MIPNGCDQEFFDQPVDHWKPLGVEESDFMAIFCGAHGIANGLISVIYAAEVLNKRNRNDIKLVLIGNGKQKQELKTIVKEAKLKNVIFHDPVPKPRLIGLMKSADLGMQILANIPAFYYGTSPNKFFDYLVAGLPVLINYPGWLADQIKEHNCGFVVEPDNSHAFADALQEASDNRVKLQKKGQSAKNLSLKYSRDDLSKKWVDLLEITHKENIKPESHINEAIN